MKEIKFSYAKIDIKYFIAFFHIAYFLYNLKKTHEYPAPYRKETKRINIIILSQRPCVWPRLIIKYYLILLVSDKAEQLVTQI